jgi:hypothetical protein
MRYSKAASWRWCHCARSKHHTTVLHSINKIEELRRSDKELNRTITRLMDALQ